jgi:hypothetical protein
MNMEYCMLHNKIVSQGMTNFEYDLAYAHGTKFYHYEVDLVAMSQNNCKTGKVRALRRLVPQAPYIFISSF